MQSVKKCYALNYFIFSLKKIKGNVQTFYMNQIIKTNYVDMTATIILRHNTEGVIWSEHKYSDVIQRIYTKLFRVGLNE